MNEDALDQWAEWLVRTRFEQLSEDERADALERLAQTRERVLDGAQLRPDDTVLDVGAGTGLITLGALARLGPDGTVIALDISVDALEELRKAVDDGRVWYQVGSADVLPLPDEDVDVVLTRSVLIYVERKEEAAREFFRVLRPGGRISLFEPINARARRVSEAVDLATLGEPADAIRALEEEIYGDTADPMVNFREGDLERAFADAGFADVRLEKDGGVQMLSSDQLLYGIGAPGRPSFVERLRERLGEEDVARIETFFDGKTVELSVPRVFLTATKAA